MKKLINLLGENYLLITFLVTLSGLIGSLYFSDVEGMVPCILCWYQRILLYPLALISGAALIMNEKFSEKLILVLSIPGAILGLYHFLLQKTDLFPKGSFCGGTSVACSTIDFEKFGFVTIPFLSFLAFFFVSVVCLIKLFNNKKSK